MDPETPILEPTTEFADIDAFVNQIGRVYATGRDMSKEGEEKGDNGLELLGSFIRDEAMFLGGDGNTSKFRGLPRALGDLKEISKRDNPNRALIDNARTSLLETAANCKPFIQAVTAYVEQGDNGPLIADVEKKVDEITSTDHYRVYAEKAKVFTKAANMFQGREQEVLQHAATNARDAILAEERRIKELEEIKMALEVYAGLEEVPIEERQEAI
jgi:hypothetical protein